MDRKDKDNETLRAEIMRLNKEIMLKDSAKNTQDARFVKFIINHCREVKE